ncbi:MAG: hypothetical protein AB8B55_04685 [Mariniblastus sp.]
MKKHAGKPLDQCLMEQSNLQFRLEMVSSAARALWQLHQHSIADWPLSHGDASVQNVFYDRESRNATWFDFDLRHSLSVSSLKRHADDLRAFLFTLAIHFEQSTFDQVITAVGKSYSSTDVWLELIEQIKRLPHFDGDVFHKSQIRRALKSKGISNSNPSTDLIIQAITLHGNTLAKRFPTHSR